MAQPTKLSQTPLSWIRGIFVGGGRAVVIIDSATPFGQDDQTMKLYNSLSESSKAKRYWVFHFPNAYLNTSDSSFSIKIPNPHTIKGYGYASYDEAEARYDEWAKAYTNTTIKKGCLNVGKDEK